MAKALRILLLLGFTLLLASCGGDERPVLGTGLPGVNVADAALAAGVPQVALNVADGILAKEPHNMQAELSRADALNALGRQREAEASYETVLAADPKSAAALIGLGRLRLRRDPAQAQVLFQTALQSDSRNTIALNNLGVALDLQGDHAAAQASYRRVLGLDTRSRAAQINLGLSMALSGQAPEAVEVLRPYASDPEAAPRIRHDLAAAMAIAGDSQAAARLLGRDLNEEQIEHALRGYEAFVP